MEWSDIIEMAARMTLAEKYKLIHASEMYLSSCSHLIGLSIDGFIAEKDFSTDKGRGEAYVYLWKHLDGDIFYVGSGVKGRNRSKNRCDGFLQEIDKGDSVVYTIVSGLTRQEAFLYEKYLTYTLRVAGVDLINGDNKMNRGDVDGLKGFIRDHEDELSQEILSEIENILLRRVESDHDFSYNVYRMISNFRDKYGTDWFSKGRYNRRWLDD
jgi:hypothetical protein